MKPTYDTSLTYDENYVRGPQFDGKYPDLSELNRGLKFVRFLGKELNSAIGVPAGPLLNSAFIKLYADLGFDVLTYKTVRTNTHPCHPFPNVRAVQTQPNWYQTFEGERPTLFTLPDENQLLAELSITNSFGMPSQPPAIWQSDVAKAKAGLNARQMLVVSVVGTAKNGGELEELAADYALAAEWARNAGADAIEANLSCPNVCSGEGSLFQSPTAVRLISQALKAALGPMPFLLKFGYLASQHQVSDAIKAAYEGGASGIAAINTIPAKVLDENNQQALPGENRLVSGICGAGIKQAGLEMLARMQQARAKLGLRPSEFTLVGVGGIMTAQDGIDYLKAGADGVQSGTGAMWQPYLARDFKQLIKQAQLLPI